MQLTAPKISQEVRDGFTPEPAVTLISTPLLSDTESTTLLECINGLRSGLKMFYVRMGHNKTGKGKPRVAGVDYKADPTLSPNSHEGWLYAAPTNKEKLVYLRMKDEARAKPDQEPELDPETDLPLVKWNYTSTSLANIFAFKVIGDAAGPLAPVKVEAKPVDPVAQQTLLAQAFQMGMTMQSNVQAAQKNG